MEQHLDVVVEHVSLEKQYHQHDPAIFVSAASGPTSGPTSGPNYQHSPSRPTIPDQLNRHEIQSDLRSEMISE